MSSIYFLSSCYPKTSCEEKCLLITRTSLIIIGLISAAGGFYSLAGFTFVPGFYLLPTYGAILLSAGSFTLIIGLLVKKICFSVKNYLNRQNPTPTPSSSSNIDTAIFGPNTNPANPAIPPSSNYILKESPFKVETSFKELETQYGVSFVSIFNNENSFINGIHSCFYLIYSSGSSFQLVFKDHEGRGFEVTHNSKKILLEIASRLSLKEDPFQKKVADLIDRISTSTSLQHLYPLVNSIVDSSHYTLRIAHIHHLKEMGEGEFIVTEIGWNQYGLLIKTDENKVKFVSSPNKNELIELGQELGYFNALTNSYSIKFNDLFQFPFSSKADYSSIKLSKFGLFKNIHRSISDKILNTHFDRFQLAYSSLSKNSFCIAPLDDKFDKLEFAAIVNSNNQLEIVFLKRDALESLKKTYTNATYNQRNYDLIASSFLKSFQNVQIQMNLLPNNHFFTFNFFIDKSLIDNQFPFLSYDLVIQNDVEEYLITAVISKSNQNGFSLLFVNGRDFYSVSSLPGYKEFNLEEEISKVSTQNRFIFKGIFNKLEANQFYCYKLEKGSVAKYALIFKDSTGGQHIHLTNRKNLNNSKQYLRKILHLNEKKSFKESISNGLIPTKRDPYTVLGLTEEASFDDVRNAYKKLAFEFHPDRNKDKDAENRFTDISNAFLEIKEAHEKKVES